MCDHNNEIDIERDSIDIKNEFIDPNDYVFSIVEPELEPESMSE